MWLWMNNIRLWFILLDGFGILFDHLIAWIDSWYCILNAILWFDLLVIEFDHESIEFDLKAAFFFDQMPAQFDYRLWALWLNDRKSQKSHFDQHHRKMEYQSSAAKAWWWEIFCWHLMIQIKEFWEQNSFKGVGL